MSIYIEAVLGSLARSGDRGGYLKQAVAAIDQKTTDCCLRVHAQAQPLDKDFHLTGEPRYADYLPYPGFHWWAIPAGELCVTANGYRPIESVRVGDLVLTHQGRFMPVTMAVSRMHTGAILEIETRGGVFRATPDHPILTDKGWKKAGTLRPSDTVLGCDVSDGGYPRWAQPFGKISIASDSHDTQPLSGNFDVANPIMFRPISMVVPVDFQIQTKNREVEHVSTLDVSDVTICDLSVEGDESYCINNHFVHNCRTATALVSVRDVQDQLSVEMRQAGDRELRARAETGRRERIWPSHARSGRT
jgi:hypothetical protein